MNKLHDRNFTIEEMDLIYILVDDLQHCFYNGGPDESDNWADIITKLNSLVLTGRSRLQEKEQNIIVRIEKAAQQMFDNFGYKNFIVEVNTNTLQKMTQMFDRFSGAGAVLVKIATAHGKVRVIINDSLQDGAFLLNNASKR